MNKDKVLQHAIAWSIQHIYNTHQEALKVLDNEEIEEKEKILLLRGPNGTDYRLLNLLLLLQPMIEVAKEEYPEQVQFFEWFDERWKMVEENNLVQKPCGCKGCKEEA